VAAAGIWVDADACPNVVKGTTMRAIANHLDTWLARRAAPQSDN